MTWIVLWIKPLFLSFSIYFVFKIVLLLVTETACFTRSFCRFLGKRLKNIVFFKLCAWTVVQNAVKASDLQRMFRWNVLKIKGTMCSYLIAYLFSLQFLMLKLQCAVVLKQGHGFSLYKYKSVYRFIFLHAVLISRNRKLSVPSVLNISFVHIFLLPGR